MMLKHFALATLPFALADLSHMGDDFKQVAGEVMPELKQASSSGQQGKSFGSSWAQEIIDSINSYGCWCYFQENHGLGKGQPVNEVDNQCKILHDGYECIMMDAAADGEECTPWNVKYNSATGLGLLAGDDKNNDSLENALRFKCRRANRKFGDCAARACMVENYFVVRTLRLFLKGVTFDPSVKHDLGLFDPSEDCPTGDGPKSDKACCGSYPLRFPYKHLDGQRGCCGEKTYNQTC